MANFWLLNRHGSDGPSLLVETDGSMKILDVLRFGPAVTELEDQQKLWDEVAGRLAPTMRPFVPAAKLPEDGVAPHVDLRRNGSGNGTRRNGASTHGQHGAGRSAGGAKRTGGRGRG